MCQDKTDDKIVTDVVEIPWNDVVFIFLKIASREKTRPK